MFDKPKRKNDEPILRRYWWIFSILAILLLINLRFPVRVTVSVQLNFSLYIAVALGCLVAIARFVRHYRWKHTLVGMMLLCNVLTGLNILTLLNIYSPTYEVSCSTQQTGVYRIYNCDYRSSTGCIEAWAKYVGFGGIPIIIEFNSNGDGGFLYCVLY